MGNILVFFLGQRCSWFLWQLERTEKVNEKLKSRDYSCVGGVFVISCRRHFIEQLFCLQSFTNISVATNS